MNKLGLNICLILGGFILSSCSTFNKMAVSSSSGLLYSAANEAETQPNYDLFKSGIAGNLILMEGLLSASPKNLNIIATLTKGFAGYAFAVNETQMYEEEWAELKSEEGRKQAMFNYTRAMNYGFRYLKEKNIEFEDILERANEPQGIHLFLDKKLSVDKRDLEVVLFTAQSLAALINLQRDNIRIISQLPTAKGMFDWVCLKDPGINYGACDIFYGAYEAGRPSMLGGNPQKGKEIFQKALAKHPHNWLIRSSFLQFYMIPQNDEEGFKEQMAVLSKNHEEFRKAYIYSNSDVGDVAWMRESHLRLFQALAMKRYELMNRFQKQFF